MQVELTAALAAGQIGLAHQLKVRLTTLCHVSNSWRQAISPVGDSLWPSKDAFSPILSAVANEIVCVSGGSKLRTYDSRSGSPSGDEDEIDSHLGSDISDTELCEELDQDLEEFELFIDNGSDADDAESDPSDLAPMQTAADIGKGGNETACSLEQDRALGSFSAPGFCIRRLDSATSWLDGTVMTLFAESRISLIRKERNVDHLPTIFMSHLGDLWEMQLLPSPDRAQEAEVISVLVRILGKVRFLPFAGLRKCAAH